MEERGETEIKRMGVFSQMVKVCLMLLTGFVSVKNTKVSQVAALMCTWGPGDGDEG